MENLKNSIIYLDLNFKDKEDNFDKGESRPFLVCDLVNKKIYLTPITSKKKKKSFIWQYLISSPKNPTCLSSKNYPFSYAILNRRIILELKRTKSFPLEVFCRKRCQQCLPYFKFANFIHLQTKYWRNPYNWISINKSRVKEIKLII